MAKQERITAERKAQQPKGETKTLGIVLNIQDFNLLQAIANERDCTISQLMRAAVEKYCGITLKQVAKYKFKQGVNNPRFNPEKVALAPKKPVGRPRKQS